MGIPWSQRAWVPAVGMKIQYRSIKHSRDYDVRGYAVIVDVTPDERLIIERHFEPRLGRRAPTKRSELKKDTWQAHWEPVSPAAVKFSGVSLSVSGNMSEDDVRRIVREELQRLLVQMTGAQR